MQWDKRPPDAIFGINYSDIIGMDPKANWLFGPGLNDYLPSLDGPGNQNRLIPFLLQFGDQAGAAAFRNIIETYEQLPSPIFLPPTYRDWLQDIDPERPGPTIVAIATQEFFDQVLDPSKAHPALRDHLDQFREARKQIRLSEPLQTQSLFRWGPGKSIPKFDEEDPLPPVCPPCRDWPAGTVIMAVIDDGMAIANDRFRERRISVPPQPDASRVQFLWSMPPVDPAHSPATLAAGFGKELAKDDDTIPLKDGTLPGEVGIDTHLRDSSTLAVIDEDDFYRRAGLVDLGEPVRQQTTARRASHGVHVLDLTAGENPRDPAGIMRGAKRPIMGVQLPVSTVEDTSGAHLEAQLILAIDYIIERADALSNAQSGPTPEQLPIVVNCSYGFIAGPHDGKSALEQALDRRVQDHPGKLRIVLPAGNSNLSRCHAVFNLSRGHQELRWRVQPDDRTPSYVEIWLPEGFNPASQSGSARVSLSVETPSGLSSFDDPGILEEGSPEILVLKDENGAILALTAYSFRPPVGPGDPGRGMYCLVLQPTVRLQPTSDPTAASGVWTIRLHNESLPEDKEIHAWIQRDDTPFGYPIRGRQSYFDEFCYKRFSEKEPPIGETIPDDSHPDQVSSPCHVKRAGLINAIATGEETIVVGGYVRERQENADGTTTGLSSELADYSAGGRPSEDEPIRGPNISAISDDSRFHIGVFATGTRSNSKIALNGTSVAAPKIARLIAEYVSGRTLPADVCSLEPRVSLTPPNPVERAGCGGVQDEKIEDLPVNEHDRFERDII